MIKNYILTSFRHLLKQRFFTFLNVVGLAIGLCAFWLINHYVTYERSYENFMENKEDIYRVQLDVYRNGELVYKSSENYAGVGAAMKEEFPEVQDYARLYNMGSKNNVIITWENGPNGPVVFKQQKFLYADASILSLFSYEMVEGDRDKALEQPYTIAISETMAKNYFGNEDALGKTLRLEDDDFNDEPCIVTGVFKDHPTNTHLKFDVLISFPTIYGRYDGALERYKTGWGRKDYYTYVKLENGSDPKALEQKLPQLVNKFKPELAEQNGEDVLLLQPVGDIHLTSRLTDEAEINGNGEAVGYLAIIAWFIIIIACINYINLSTAKSVERAKEVGLRKVVGSQKAQLIVHFLIESSIVFFLSILIAFVLVLAINPLFNNIGGVPSSYVIWTQSWFWISAGLFWFAGSLISGFYPAIVLSSFKPVDVLKGQFKGKGSGIFLRKALVVMQFTTSIALIIGTFIVYEQMSFMKNQDLGYNTDQVMVVERPSTRDTSNVQAENDYMSFKNGLSDQPMIAGVAGSGMLPGKKLRFKTQIRNLNQDPSEATTFAVGSMDYELFDLMDMEMLAGRNFSREFIKDPDTAIVINEYAARALGFTPEEIVGKYISVDRFNWKPQVIGVLKNIHNESLQEAMQPLAFFLQQYNHEYMMVKMSTNNIEETVAVVNEQWDKSFAGNPFEFFFLDSYFDSYYKSEKSFSDLFLIFTILAILIGCLGLFGLSSYTAVQKTKEIGIRKVLGSSTSGIISLMFKDFVILIGIANLIAWPVAWYFLSGWLENYPYHISINFLLFGLAALLVLIIAFLTVSFHTFKTAQLDPAKTLKYE
ncbi:ABC transporter permease [Ekhidna sp. To15]|uniref:ABC transporter permease n=1 Tax=Ekhidna sp. To15 TaxID=3395267 RepID=UPI003F524F81